MAKPFLSLGTTKGALSVSLKVTARAPYGWVLYRYRKDASGAWQLSEPLGSGQAETRAALAELLVQDILCWSVKAINLDPTPQTADVTASLLVDAAVVSTTEVRQVELTQAQPFFFFYVEVRA